MFQRVTICHEMKNGKKVHPGMKSVYPRIFGRIIRDHIILNQSTLFCQNWYIFLTILCVLCGDDMQKSKWIGINYNVTPVGFLGKMGDFSFFPAFPWKQMQPLLRPKSLVNHGSAWSRCTPTRVSYFWRNVFGIYSSCLWEPACKACVQ